MSGHLFVVRGDLTKLSCDAVLVPTSAQRDVTKTWLSVLPPERVSKSHSSWWRVNVDVPSTWPEERVVRVPETSDGRDVWLVRTDSWDRPPAWVGEGLAAGVQAAAASFRGSNRRHKRLIGVPLAGTGDGGLANQRGAVVEALIPRLTQQARDSDVDVALVLHGEGDHVAVQAARNEPGTDVLTDEQILAADRLGELAAHRHLVLFLGAGVSMAAGMPSWPALLHELADEAKVPISSLASFAATDAAQIMVDAIGTDRFKKLMHDRFTMTRHSLAHGLLAGLGAQEVVTTNFDNGYELAASHLQPLERPVRVLPRQEAAPDCPWLLKLHGDAAFPESIVLTRDQYLEYGDLRGPLTGMVQALLLTRHMLFVGFSLVDDNFARLAHQVRRLLAQDGNERLLGTVLFLQRDKLRERLWQKELHHVAMSEGGGLDSEAARLLEIFLDRVAWTAQRSRGGLERLLLNPAYDGMQWSPDDVDLRRRLRDLADRSPAASRRTGAWQAMAKSLRAYGADI